MDYKETTSHRWEMCKSCEHFRESTKQCKQCGCFMFLKILNPQAKCPLNKW
jgi:hypothetical protein